MRSPEMLLPPASMPWGRWLTDKLDDTEREIDAFETANSGQSKVQNATLDGIANQIRGLRAGTTIVRDVAPFSQFCPAVAVGSTPNFAYSPSVTTSTPTPRGAKSCRVIFNFTVTDDADTTIADRGMLFTRINGTYGLDQRTWGPGGSTLVPYVGARSAMTIDPNARSEYTAQFCMRIPNYGVSGNVTFSDIKFTYIFYGEL